MWGNPLYNNAFGGELMRIILKLIALPVVVVLTLMHAALSFLNAIATQLCWLLCVLLLVCCAFSFIVESDSGAGVRELIAAFLLSPFGVPALAEWAIDKLDDFNYALHCFIAG